VLVKPLVGDDVDVDVRAELLVDPDSVVLVSELLCSVLELAPERSLFGWVNAPDHCMPVNVDW